MKALFIGGTGNISLSLSRALLREGHDLWLLNRSGSHEELSEANFIQGDIGAPDLPAKLADHEWDVVVNWIAFGPDDIERDLQLFADRIFEGSELTEPLSRLCPT